MRIDGARADDRQEVWQCNWMTVHLFAALGTQWRVGATGLDYAAIAPTARLMGIKLTPARFAGLRVMEAATLEAMAAERERSGRR